jgi:hypothetical protein
VALETAQNGQHGADEVARGVTALVLSRDQVDGDLAVGFAGELHARSFQLGPQRGEVLDDPIMNDRDLAGSVAMRMRIAAGRPAVGGPPRVAERGASGQNRRIGVPQRRLQIGKAPGAPGHRQSTPAVS